MSERAGGYHGRGAHPGLARRMVWAGRHWRWLFVGPEAILYPPETSAGAEQSRAGAGPDPQTGVVGSIAPGSTHRDG